LPVSFFPVQIMHHIISYHWSLDRDAESTKDCHRNLITSFSGEALKMLDVKLQDMK